MAAIATTTLTNLPPRVTEGADHELVRRCLARDPIAWRALYQKYYARVIRVVHSIGIGDGEADDLCQEIFIILYRHLGSFRGEARLSTWIHRVATREAIRHAKRRRLRRRLNDLFGKTERHEIPADWTESQATRRRLLTQLLDSLPPERRMALVMFEIEGRSVEEIATMSGCATNTVWTRIHRARVQLEKLAGGKR